MPSGSIVQTRPTIGFDHEVLVISNAVKTLTESVYAPSGGEARAERALVTVEGADIRYKYSGGSDPTSSIGHLLTDGNFIVLEGINQIQMFKCIRAASTDATIQVTVERE